MSDASKSSTRYTATKAYHDEYRKRDYVMEANRQASIARARRLAAGKIISKMADMSKDELIGIFAGVFAARGANYATKQAEIEAIATIMAASPTAPATETQTAPPSSPDGAAS